MATGDVLSISNRALLSIGARKQVSSVMPSDGSAEANAISVLWTPTFESLARSAHWNALRKQRTLSLIQAAQGTPENPSGTSMAVPPTPWLYAYAYPDDCLDMQFVVPSLPVQVGGSVPATTINNAAGSWLPSGGQIVYAVATTYDTKNTPTLSILTNQCQAQAVYTVNQPNPAGWDSLFQAAMVASLAAFLVPALSLSLPMMQLSIGVAEKIIKQARTADGNEGVTTLDHTPDWMRARAGAGGYWSYGGFSTYGGYCNVAWPDYGGPA